MCNSNVFGFGRGKEKIASARRGGFKSIFIILLKHAMELSNLINGNTPNFESDKELSLFGGRNPNLGNE